MSYHLADIPKQPGSEESEGVRIGVGIAEYANQVDLSDKARLGWQEEMGGAQTNKDSLASRSCGLVSALSLVPRGSHTHHDRHLHTAFHPRALKDGVETLRQPFDRLDPLAFSDKVPVDCRRC